MQHNCGLLLIGHGTHDFRGRDGFMTTLDQVADLLPDHPVDGCFLEAAAPDILTVLEAMAADGLERRRGSSPDVVRRRPCPSRYPPGLGARGKSDRTAGPAGGRLGLASRSIAAVGSTFSGGSRPRLRSRLDLLAVCGPGQQRRPRHGRVPRVCTAAERADPGGPPGNGVSRLGQATWWRRWPNGWPAVPTNALSYSLTSSIPDRFCRG